MLSKSAALCGFLLAASCRSPNENPLASSQPAAAPSQPAAALGPAAPAPARSDPAPPRVTPLETAAPTPSGSGRAARAHSVLVVGDSLSDPRVGGGRFLRAVTEACPATTVDNHARGGFMVNQMRRRFEAELGPRLPGGYTDLLVFGGVNDLYSDETAGRSVDKIQRDLGALYAAGRAHGLRVIAFTVAPWGGFSRYFTERRARTTEQLNAWIAEQREQGKVDVVVDAYALLSCGDPERLCPKFEAPRADGLHFGPLGHARLGEELLKQAFADCAR